MTYKREPGFNVRANLAYENDREDAAYIAQEVINKGRSTGWTVEAGAEQIAAEIEAILAGFNIGLVDPVAGVWSRKVGGTRHFR